jgi:hypothetical protein
MAKEFTCEGCEKTFMGSDENLSEYMEASRLWPNIPMQDMATLCPDCDRKFRKWYAQNFSVTGGRTK